MSHTRCLICCPVETEEAALESSSDTPEKETYPDMNRGRLTLWVRGKTHTRMIKGIIVYLTLRETAMLS